MESLKQKIYDEGKVLGEDILKVDSFLNHQMDVRFFEEIGAEIRKRYEGEKIDKILTVEVSGIGISCIAARYLDYVPVVFAKKATANTMVEGCYSEEAKSFTKSKVLRDLPPFWDKGDTTHAWRGHAWRGSLWVKSQGIMPDHNESCTFQKLWLRGACAPQGRAPG